jgi:hypothetical protein
MEVRVVKRAFVGGRVVEPGMVIIVPDGTVGSAFVPADSAVPPEAKKADGIEAMFGPAIPKPAKPAKVEAPNPKASPL